MSRPTYNLNVFWNNILAGYLTATNSGGVKFSYNKYWIDKCLPPLSISLPVEDRQFAAGVSTSFFSNLLPEEGLKSIISQIKHISRNDCFAFLEEYGKECAGALVITVEDNIQTLDTPQYFDATKKIAEILQSHREETSAKIGLFPAINARLSLAGAQDKLPVRFEGNKFLLPVNYEPTTHIIKPANDRFPSIVANEVFCMKLAKACGFNVPEVQYFMLNEKALYICERFDRKITESGIMRIHQEDFCQAMGIPSEKKYEEQKGPAFVDLLEVIRENSFINAVAIEKTIFDISIFNFLIGNTDAHGKNFSILHKENQLILAPFYDLVSCLIYSNLDDKFSMAYGGRFKNDKIKFENFTKHGNIFGFSKKLTIQYVNDMCSIMASTIPIVMTECSNFSDTDKIFLEKLVQYIQTKIRATISLCCNLHNDDLEIEFVSQRLR